MFDFVVYAQSRYADVIRTTKTIVHPTAQHRLTWLLISLSLKIN